MALSQAQINRLVDLIRIRYPDWSSFTDPRFEQDEVLYKKKAASKALELLNPSVLDELSSTRRHDEIIKRLSSAGAGNNLLFQSVPERGDLGILRHPQLEQVSFCEAMIDLLHGNGSSPERLERYLAYVQERQLPSKWTFPTYYLFLLHPDKDLFVKPRAFRRLLERLGMRDMLPASPSAGAYAYVLGLARSIAEGLQDFGPRDMIDVHSAMWIGGTVKQGEPLTPIKTPGEVINGSPRRYWMLAAGEGGRLWNEFTSLGIAAIGWDYLGDLRQYSDQEALAKAIMAHREGDEYPTNDSLACYQFAHEIRGGDAVLVKRGLSTFLGYGIVDSDYVYDPSRREYHHVRHVRWVSQGEWELPEHMQLASKTLTDITPYTELLEYILPLVSAPALQPAYSLEECSNDTGIAEGTLGAWIEAIERKGQAIIYGPPGTGKTWAATHLARHLIERSDGFTDLVQFHPSYAYEDFIQGIRPESGSDGNLRYPIRPGRFLEFCRRASRSSGRCVLIIDEINRGNLSRIFGELMFLLEYRERAIPLAGGGHFQIPKNVRLLGTMNTADRSIALVDHALRRRFAFLPLYPDFELLSRYHDDGALVAGLIATLRELNDLIGDPHYALGVSYFLTKRLGESLESIWRMEIEPYLEEQFFDRRQRVEQYRWEKVRERLGL